MCVCLFFVFGLTTFQKRQREPLRQLHIRGESTRCKFKLPGNASVARLFIEWKKMSVRAEIEKNKQTNKQKQRQKTCLNRKKKFCETQHIAWKTWIRLFFHPCLKCNQQECCSMKINHESLESKIIVSIPKIYCYEHKMKSKYWYHQEYRHLHLFIGSFLVLFFMQN